MKKRAFTLAELLIALGIIGIAAAVMSPAIMDIMPDKNKLKILNCYNAISDATEKLLANRELYYPKISYVESTGKYTQTCYGLDCTDAPMNSDYVGYSGSDKYKRLLFEALKIGNDNKFADNSVWSVSKKGGDYIITIDVDGSKGKNCSYKSACKNPDQFEFKVDKYGVVEANDALTHAYLLTPDNINNKKEDFAVAESNKNNFN